MTVPTTVRIQREPFDVAAEAKKLTHGRTDAGAVVTFTGICRGSEAGEPIAALTLEHYPGHGGSGDRDATSPRRPRAGRCSASLSFIATAASCRAKIL